MILDLVGSRSRIVRRPLPENDPKQRQPDISLAQKLLNWKPYIPLKEGLVKTIAYFEHLLAEQDLRTQLVKEL
jgi:UDP-glucuronate decarboxylase